MTPERWEKVREVLLQVLELAPEKRSQFLDDACQNDPSLRGEVESLLSSDESARSSFLQSVPVQAPALTKGTRLGNYEIVSLVGLGGMGEVYRARDTRLKRDVAIKVLPAYWSRDPERLQRFELEAQAAAALNHSNIVSIFGVGQYDGAPYIVTELLSGETLRARLRKGPLRLREALDLGVEIARGLGVAHAAGIVHRDLKPENIFLTKDGRVKILDFGLAKLAPPKTASDADPTYTGRQQTTPGQMLGTVGYMSPEQVRGQPADARSDIFSAGAVLYEMLTGHRAFHKPTSAETMTAILNEDPPSVSQVAPNLPPASQRVVNRCLAKNPEQRFQHASDVAFALEALSDSNSGVVSAVKQPASARRWIWIAASAALLAITVAIVMWWNRPPAVPVVEAITQVTDDGHPKANGSLVTDGSRIYFNEGVPGGKKIMQVSTAGGDTTVVSTRLTDPQTEGIAPDGSALMVFDGEGDIKPLWIVPLPTGEPRRLGTIEGQDGGFFPDGGVVFAQHTDLFAAEKDGSNVRRLLAVGDYPYCPRVSPDGRRIVVRAYAQKDQSAYLAELAADGSGYHEIMRGSSQNPVQCGYWTPDGHYVVTRRYGGDIWLLPMTTGLIEKRHKPIQLTNGPLLYSSLCPSRDGKRIFAIGSKLRGELVQYDKKSNQFIPFLSGISAISLTFSRDGQWVAYVSYPDYTLWRSRADGTDRLQLTYPPTEVVGAAISPDGTRVAFSTNEGNPFVMNLDGTSQREIPRKDAYLLSWSPDGNSLLLHVLAEGKHVGEKNSRQLETIDLRSGNRSVVASSQGTDAGLWITSDTVIAVTDDSTKLVAIDFQSGKQAPLVSGLIVDFAASLDQKYVYYATGGAEPKAMRIRLSDRKVEEITSLKNLLRPMNTGAFTTSVAPDGSPVFTRDIGTQEIYALTVKWP